MLDRAFRADPLPPGPRAPHRSVTGVPRGVLPRGQSLRTSDVHGNGSPCLLPKAEGRRPRGRARRCGGALSKGETPSSRRHRVERRIRSDAALSFVPCLEIAERGILRMCSFAAPPRCAKKSHTVDNHSLSEYTQLAIPASTGLRIVPRFLDTRTPLRYIGVNWARLGLPNPQKSSEIELETACVHP